jgi:uncharacterized protein (TIGR00255 family)
LNIHSMTGYARNEGHNEHCSWTWEVRGVNGKGLDVRCRLPGGFEAMEAIVRDQVKKRLRRGNISLSLNIDWNSQGSAYGVNQDVLNGFIAMLPELAKQAPDATPASLDGLLSLKGVIESRDDGISEETRQELEKTLLASLDETLGSMLAMRGEEGARLGNVLSQQISTIEDLCNEAGKVSALRPEFIRKRLKEQVESLLEDVPSLSAERLEQEAALLMTKADISEELDRLAAHVSAARDLMGQDAAIGRKLDFLCQEFNREANTLCSKSGDVELTRIGLDMKAMIEQFREQVQNIE